MTRITDAAEELAPIVDRLRAAAEAAGYYSSGTFSVNPVEEAILFTAISCDFDADDFETLEATMLARLDDTQKTGER